MRSLPRSKNSPNFLPNPCLCPGRGPCRCAGCFCKATQTDMCASGRCTLKGQSRVKGLSSILKTLNPSLARLNPRPKQGWGSSFKLPCKVRDAKYFPRARMFKSNQGSGSKLQKLPLKSTDIRENMHGDIKSVRPNHLQLYLLYQYCSCGI